MTFVLVFPLTFASTTFLPAEGMNPILRSFVENQPITQVAEAVRALMLGEPAWQLHDALRRLESWNINFSCGDAICVPSTVSASATPGNATSTTPCANGCIVAVPPPDLQLISVACYASRKD